MVTKIDCTIKDQANRINKIVICYNLQKFAKLFGAC
jgi:hypothetical protein